MVALEQLRRAVPMPPYEDTTPEEEPETAAEIQAATGLNYVQHRPPQIPVPPLRPAPPPPKHHRRPEPRDSGQSRPMSARSAGPVRPTPPTRPSSARSAPLGRAVCLPTSIDATLDMTSSVAEAVAVAAAASVGISQSGPRPTTPRAAAWQPPPRPWSVGRSRMARTRRSSGHLQRARRPRASGIQFIRPPTSPAGQRVGGPTRRPSASSSRGQTRHTCQSIPPRLHRRRGLSAGSPWRSGSRSERARPTRRVGSSSRVVVVVVDWPV